MRATSVRRLLAPQIRRRTSRAIRLRWSIELLGLRLGRDRVVHVVDELPPDQVEAERDVVTAAEADALIALGHADPIRTGTVIRFPEPW